ncbi:MAG TPA: Holliday junction resolvase RuvX [Candidatus Saccharimonadales bacterium]|nr:Holliday junction resolvase RuvX [Candidatus Saccharimonadales bacterium]
MLTVHSSVLGLDVGSKRIGIAVASLAARLPRPLTTLEFNGDFFAALDAIIKTEDVGTLVIGLPRNLEGSSTAQTEAVETFIERLQEHSGLPVHRQDEALTSRKAEAELEARGKPYKRGDIDALAATYILQDWLAEQPREDA